MSPVKAWNNARALIQERRWEKSETIRWTLARMGIQAYVIFSFFTVLGGVLTYPLATKILLDDWRFWQHLPLGPRLYVFMLRAAGQMLSNLVRGRRVPYGFMFSVPLSAAPTTRPDPRQARLRPDWPHAASCGPCANCCSKLGCPILDEKSGLCRGYNSIYWRYFNCGRFPISAHQLDYYQCAKWELITR